MATRKSHIRNGHCFRKYLSLFMSFIIVFNVTMIPAFAEGEDTAEEPAQEEQTQEESDISEASSDEESDPESSDEEQPAEAEEEPEGGEEEPEDEPVEDAEPEEHVGGEGKYVKDVYIVYAATEESARNALRVDGWEPLSGNADFNAGKASRFDDDLVAMMGIRRTDKKEEAITDMAVMNMKGGYSFPDYQSLLKEKKTEINEFINSFVPVLEEYRANYNGKGSSEGEKRAELAYEILNKFYDGGKGEPYAVNDTGEPLGQLLLNKTVQEGGGAGSADLQQIMLESSGPAVTMVEVCLALATDTAGETWIERLKGLSGDELSKNLSKYVPEAKDQDVAPSAVNKFLKQHFGDQAKMLSAQWDSVHDQMVWFEEYNEKNDLWQQDGESDMDYADRIEKHFKEVDKASDGATSEEHEKYNSAFTLYNSLYEVPYETKWGDTLGDFFNPAEGGYDHKDDNFLPFAAALSKGQRAAGEVLSLETLLMLGMSTEDSVKALFPQIEKVFKGAENLSVYTGMNRGIFRGGVALTNAALMEKNQNGYDPFADMWSFSGIYNITVYAAAITGIVTLGAGFGYLMSIKHTEGYLDVLDKVATTKNRITIWQNQIDTTRAMIKAAEAGKLEEYSVEFLQEDLATETETLQKYQSDLNKYKSELPSTMGARVIMGIGGALLVGAALAKGYQLYRYYNRTFTQIPMYMVDEADIVSYQKDDEGNETKLIDFDQFVYYSAVKCNRQEIGDTSRWQDGVSDYASWGCGDAADLNGDFGQQWLALYKVRSERKGDPILADSLTLQYGDSTMPEGCSKALHMFTYENAADLGDTAYSFNNKMKGVYFFWDVDEGAFDDKGAASAFDGGTAAIAGGLGLLVGIIGTAIVMRKKKEQ